MRIQIHYFDTIDSTNAMIERMVAAGADEGYVAYAGEQTAGRGRSGHQWESPEGVSVSTSILLFPNDVPTERIPRLTIIAALAVAQAIESLYPLEAKIKWPNDILVMEKKICGILTERHPELRQPQKGIPVVVGIGVNVHHKSFPEELSRMAISIDMALEQLINEKDGLNGTNDLTGSEAQPDRKENEKRPETHRKDVCEMIWKKFSILYEDFVMNKGSLSGILEEYNQRLINRGRKVRVLDPAGEYEAHAICIDDEGRLIVESENGQKKIDSGEVSVRGIYGYV